MVTGVAAGIRFSLMEISITMRVWVFFIDVLGLEGATWLGCCHTKEDNVAGDWMLKLKLCFYFHVDPL